MPYEQKSRCECGKLSVCAPSAGCSPDPEFVGYQDARRMFGLTRSYLYQLASRGNIRSVSLKERGRLHGKRLFDVQSIRDFLRSRTVGGPLHHSMQEGGLGLNETPTETNLGPSQGLQRKGEEVER